MWSGCVCACVRVCEDRPDPPTDLELSDPHERSVRLSWVPGNSHHNPITGERCPGKSVLSIFTDNFCHLHLQITWCSMTMMTGCPGSGKTCHCIQGTSTLSFCICYLSPIMSSGSLPSMKLEWVAQVVHQRAFRAVVLVSLLLLSRKHAAKDCL